jgi:hypothetical protein
MSKKIFCPNINHTSYKNLLNRVGDKSLAYYIWDKVGGNISDNGLPFAEDFRLLDARIQSIILKSLPEEHVNIALLNTEFADNLSEKYIVSMGKERAPKDFSFAIKTSDGSVLTLKEKRASIDEMVYHTSRAFISNNLVKVVDIFNIAKKTFEKYLL